MRCQYCGSKMIHPEVQHKHFSTGKAVAGAALIGVVGAAAGFIGKDKKGYGCGACGAWSERPMDIITDSEIDRSIRDARNGKNVGLYEAFRTQYPNIENIVFSNNSNAQHNPAFQTPTESFKLLKEDIEPPKTVDEENVSTVKHRYKYNGYALGSPILINEIEIKEGENGDRLSLNIKNISQSEIRSAYFNVEAFDDAGDKVSENSFAIQGSSVKSGEFFPKGKDYDLKSDMSYYVVLKCQKVVFSDNSVWRLDESAQEVELQEQSIISDEEFPKYKYLVQLLEEKNKWYTAIESVFAPVFENDFVQCFCGCPFERNSKCPQCGLSEDDIVNSLSSEKLSKKQISDVKKIAKERTKNATKRRDSAFSALYKQALSWENGKEITDVSTAAEYFCILKDYKDSAELAQRCQEKLAQAKKIEPLLKEYEKATQSNSIKDYQHALSLLNGISDYPGVQEKIAYCREKLQKFQDLKPKQEMGMILNRAISCKPDHESPMHAAVASDGKVFISCEENFRKTNLLSWTDIVYLSHGLCHTLGLRRDGTVSVCGNNMYGQCNVTKWKGITQIAAGGWHSVGLKDDGTVVAVGFNDFGQVDVSRWNDIVQIAAGRNHTVGLKRDGTVVATGLRDTGCCNVSHWKNIVKIFAYNGYTIGIKNDGTVESTKKEFLTSNWRDIVDIATGLTAVLGLKSDGTVVAGSTEKDILKLIANISKWHDITAVSVLNAHCVGLKSDGTVVACGLNDNGQCNVKSWKNIAAVSAGAFITLGIKENGSVISAGSSNGSKIVQSYDMLYSWHLFDNPESYVKNYKRLEETLKLQSERRLNNLCAYCGGNFKKGLFSEKCIICGKPKNY